MLMHGREAGVAVSSAPSSGFILPLISAGNSSWRSRGCRQCPGRLPSASSQDPAPSSGRRYDRRDRLFFRKRSSPRTGLYGPSGLGQRAAGGRLHHLSEQDTRKRDRHKAAKNLSFGLTVYAGLAGAVIGIWQMALYAGASPALVWLVIGGSLNFASGLPVGYVLCYTLAHEGYGLLSVSCCVVTQL